MVSHHARYILANNAAGVIRFITQEKALLEPQRATQTEPTIKCRRVWARTGCAASRATGQRRAVSAVMFAPLFSLVSSIGSRRVWTEERIANHRPHNRAHSDR
jgi:hypothetical protein